MSGDNTDPRAASGQPAGALAVAVRAAIARRCGLPPADLHDDLTLADPALGLDSVALVELVLECERLAGGTLPADLLAGGGVTVGELVARVVAAASP